MTKPTSVNVPEFEKGSMVAKLGDLTRWTRAAKGTAWVWLCGCGLTFITLLVILFDSWIHTWPLEEKTTGEIYPAFFSFSLAGTLYLGAFAVCLTLALSPTISLICALFEGKTGQLTNRMSSDMFSTALSLLLWMPVFLLSAQEYFALKTYGALYGKHIEGALVAAEYPVLGLIGTLASTVPKGVVLFFNWVYTHIWYQCHMVMNVVLCLPDKRPANRLMLAVVACYTAGGIIHRVLPAMSPIYAASDLFSHLPKTLFSLKIHAASLLQHQTLLKYGSMGYDVIKEAQGPLAAPLPICAFPSLHIAFSVIIVMLLRDVSTTNSKVKALLTGLGVVFAAVITAGSLILGFHYVADDIAGFILGYGCWKFAEFWTEIESEKMEI